MVVVRPVRSTDLEALLALSASTGVGLTTLPADKAYLKKRIAKSERSFAADIDRPGTEVYLLVMEDLASGRIVGSSAMVAKVGGYEPFYAYKIETQLFESDVLKVRREVPVLRLFEEHDGPAEIGSLFLHADFRGHGNGRFLQLVRFLFMAEFPQRFESTVVSEIRGVCTDAGISPFWNALGRHFFEIDFPQADYLSVTNKKFIADLMPDHPVYIPILPESAQEVIGKPHPQSERAMRNLMEEGFAYANMVDIFDVGPALIAPRDSIRAVAESRRAVVSEVVKKVQSPLCMIGTCDGPNFRACTGNITATDDRAVLSAEAASALQIRLGDPVRYVELFPAAARRE